MIPRDLSGQDLARLPRRYGYEVTRQSGSHIRLTSTFAGAEHHITIPAHRSLRVSTLHGVLSDVAAYLHIDRGELLANLFGR